MHVSLINYSMNIKNGNVGYGLNYLSINGHANTVD